MCDVPECVEAKNVQARRATEQEAETLSQEIQRCMAEADRIENKMRIKAARRLLLRVLVALLIIGGLTLALHYSLISWLLAFPIQLVALVWAAVDFGAWLQYDGKWEGRYL